MISCVSKKEASFGRELRDSFKQSNDNFLKAMNVFNKPVSQLDNGLCRSIDMLARAIYVSNHATQNQNMYFPRNIEVCRGIPRKRCSENMQQIYRKTLMPK